MPRSLANTAAIFAHPASHADAVRLGIGLYGATPFADRPAEKLGLNQQVADTTPKVNTLKREEVLAQVMTVKGDRNLGEQLFTRQGCVACHTTSLDQQPKGPYLGNIAQTYKRAELAENIIELRARGGLHRHVFLSGARSETVLPSRALDALAQAASADVPVALRADTRSFLLRVFFEAMQGMQAFDLGIFDEAHKTAGREGAKFGFALV